MANWLSTKSVAEKYGIPKEQIREWIRLRYLTCSSIGTEPYEDNDPLIDTDELDKALEFNSLKSYPDDTMMERAVSYTHLDVAHPIFIGIHGNVENPEILENLNYINIDILDHKEKQLDYQGCLAINAGDNNLIRNVRFENIRIEDFRQGQLVNLRIFFNEKYCKAPGRGIENILFKDISYTGKDAEVSMIIGYDKERKVKNIRFENLTINGEVIYRCV